MSSRDSGGRPGDRPWLVALGVVVLGALIASPWLADLWGEWTTSLRDAVVEASESGLGAESSAGGSASVLVAVTDEDRITRSLALMTRADGENGLLALAPTQLFDLLPGFGEFPLSQATVFEGTALTPLAFQNAFGVRVDAVVELGPGQLAAAIANPVDVTLSAPLIVEADDGTTQFVGNPGTGRYAPDVVETLLTTQGSAEVLAWLERQAAVWEAVLAAAGVDTGVVDAIAAGAANGELAAGVIAAVATSSPQVTLIPVERSAGAGGTDGFTIDTSNVAGFVQSRISHLELGDVPRPRVEVLNGNGRLQATRPLVAALVRAGFRVVRTDNAVRFDFVETLVIAQGNDSRPAAERAAAAIGIGSLQVELTSPSGVVDVSIIVGQDVPAGEG